MQLMSGEKSWIKWVAYSIELFLMYVLEQTPNLIPDMFGAYPSLVMCVCISVAIFEGEVPGLFFGLAGGLMLDYTSTKIFGFYALFLTVLCYFCGLLVVNLMRNNIVTTMLLGSASVLIMGIVKWFFFYVLWDYPSLFYHLYAFILPSVLYTVLLLPVFFYFTRVVSTHLSVD